MCPVNLRKVFDFARMFDLELTHSYPTGIRGTNVDGRIVSITSTGKSEYFHEVKPFVQLPVGVIYKNDVVTLETRSLSLCELVSSSTGESPPSLSVPIGRVG